MKLLVTGGAGFIGSNFIRYWLKKYPNDKIINLDKLTYAGHLSSTKDFADNPNYKFVKGDICDERLVNQLVGNINIVVHFAAESHVDRSILDPLTFVKTNVLGTVNLLSIALKKKIKRFHHVSTDEVFGQLGLNNEPFDEDTKYDPRTPYSASKAGSDHLVRSYFETYGLPVTISNCGNNFGRYQDPEKLIPHFITNLIEGKKVPLMGWGENIRDWIYVEDHCRAIETILEKGKVGKIYLIGGEEKTNLEVTELILKLLEKDSSWIKKVGHRLGHDFRYAINDEKLRKLGWKSLFNFETRLKETVDWYINNKWWWKPLIRQKKTVS